MYYNNLYKGNEIDNKDYLNNYFNPYEYNLEGNIKNKNLNIIPNKSNIHFDSVNNLLKYLETFNYKRGDTIYIKGAHNIGLYKIVPRCIEILQNL